ncbi:lysophosphatidic acid receptor 6-like [Sinocyclocheilus rhinocerous]|uniref:Lysophosphatidic acid receptor 6-like n=1 Tax=Sinocyclocheilus rhinocerous TaxID=307959 RepID=A0A673G6U5_9TELE|nr:PREDICTED: lysophosphatidic acid receptor 6-like [Sinocyclocheilus rhinocerous]
MSNLTNLTCPKSEKDQVFVVVYSVVFIFGLILNLTALVIFFRNSKSRSHTTVYMIHLAFADIILVCTLPVRIYYHGGLGVPNLKICEFAGLILLSNMYSSIFLLTCISLDRCVAVCFPLSSRVREGRKKAWCVCLGIWILTITTSLLIYFQKKQDNTQHNITCFSSFPRISTQKPALASTLIVGFGIPLTVMIVSSWGLIRAISKSTAVQTSDLVDSGRIKRMIITNVAIFLFCFLPYHVMLVLLDDYKNPCSLLTAYQYSLMVACLNAMLDPVAYYFTTETFQRKMDVEAVRKKWQMNSHSSEGNNCSRAHNVRASVGSIQLTRSK